MVGIFYSTEQGPLSSDEALARLQKQNTGLAGLPQFAPGNNPLNIMPMAQFPGLQNNGFNQPRVHFDGRFPLNGFDTALTGQNNLTYTKNSHTFKMGIWWEKAAFRQARSGNFSGEFNFQQNANNPRSTGNAFIGSFDSYVEGLGRVADNRVQNTVAWYVQDDWKIRRNLTLNIGLRMYRWGRNLQQGGEASQFTFERFDPRWDGNPPILFTPTGTGANRRALNPLNGALLPANYIGTIVPGTGYSCTGQLSAENPCIFNGIVIQENGDYVDGGRGFIDPIPILFDPRFGFAWDPFGNGKTAIRGSWGTFHVATGGADYRKGGPAFQFDQRIVYGDIATMLTATPVTNPVNVEGTWKDRKQQVNYQYNFGIQQDIGKRTILDIAYVGYATRHRELTWNYNMLPAGIRFRPENREASATPLPDNFLRPFIGFGDINIRGNGGTDRYDSLQVQLNRRFTGGVEIAANYTYQNGLQTGWFQQLNVVNKERMVDIQTHVLNFSYVIDLPRGSNLVPGAIGRAVFDNWQVSGVTTFANGKPTNVELTTTDNFDFSGGGESCGVVLTGPAILPRGERTVNRWFNTSVFKRPSGPGDLGNDCSNYKFRAPGINNCDVSFFKNFPVGEGKRFQLRWEMYNVFNHTQFETVNTTARFNPQGEQVNAAFGQVTAARQERRMQVGLRFSF